MRARSARRAAGSAASSATIRSRGRATPRQAAPNPSSAAARRRAAASCAATASSQRAPAAWNAAAATAADWRCAGAEGGGAHVQDPNLDRVQTLLAQPLAMFPHFFARGLGA
jgi:hypothetical protein